MHRDSHFAAHDDPTRKFKASLMARASTNLAFLSFLEKSKVTHGVPRVLGFMKDGGVVNEDGHGEEEHESMMPGRRARSM